MSGYALVIYSQEDVDKNKKFIEICGQTLKKHNIELKLYILEKDKLEGYENIIFAINRSRNCDVGKMLEEKGIRVYNTSLITEIFNDKWKTYLWAKENDIPVVKTAQSKEALNAEYPLVVKSCAGHGGSEVFLVNNDEEYFEATSVIKGDFIVQPFADTGGRDIRTYVIGEKKVVSMERASEGGFKSNFSLGGNARRTELYGTEMELVEKITSIIKPDYVGIDLMYDGQQLVLNEIEDAVGARMVYANTDIDIIAQFIEYIVFCAKM